MPETHDVIIIGAGAAGLMAAATAGYRGRRVLVLDHARKAGQKILMSGGGRCNFTHLDSGPEHFLSDNPPFCISALKRYTPRDFLELVERHGVEWEEKAPGQLFSRDGSRAIRDLLLTECEWAGVTIRLRTTVEGVERRDDGFHLETSGGPLTCESLVVATGGLSIPTMGATGFGHELARRFGLTVLPTRPGLVPFTLEPALKEALSPLAGISVPVTARAAEGPSFREPLLMTHRGLSGPAMLQVSSYWRPGEAITLDMLPEEAVHEALTAAREAAPQSTPARFLGRHWPKRFAEAFAALHGWSGPLQGFANSDLDAMATTLREWSLTPAGTEGYRTAEVTLGGVDTRALSSKTMAVREQPDLFFIGEVLDVTGHLGGHNFQWAWASGVAAGLHV